MGTNARKSTRKIWRFGYERPLLKVVYHGEVAADSLDEAIHQFRDAKPNGRIVSIDGIRYFDDGRSLHGYKFSSGTDIG